MTLRRVYAHSICVKIFIKKLLLLEWIYLIFFKSRIFQLCWFRCVSKRLNSR